MKEGTGKGGFWLAPLGLVLAVAAVYINSFSVPLLLDDPQNVLRNPSIWSLSPFWKPFLSFRGSGLAGRPAVNFTLALNYAASGFEVWSYHVVNLAIHAAAALALFGIIRRTILLPQFSERYGKHAVWLAFSATLLWAVHPLQVESVAYISQRCESQMGMFFLVAFYSAMRGFSSDRRGVWFFLSVAAFFAGMWSKEVMAAAPVVIFLYHVFFVEKRPGRAVKSAWPLYAGYALGLALFLVFMTTGRSVDAAMGGEESIPALRYLLLQSESLFIYFKLAFFPARLCFEYGSPGDQFYIHTALIRDLWPYHIFAVGVLAVSLWAFLKRRPEGFLMAAFFIILAPTTSFVPLNVITVEHRMYLSLACLTILVVFGIFKALRRMGPGAVKFGMPVVIGVLALALGGATLYRNSLFSHEVAIYQDTVDKRPRNARAHDLLGAALAAKGRRREAAAHFAEAMRLERRYPSARYNLAVLFLDQGKTREAAALLEEALRINPRVDKARVLLANLRMDQGQYKEAASLYKKVLETSPGLLVVRHRLALALAMDGRTGEAEKELETLLNQDPAFVPALKTLGDLAAQKGDFPRAAALYQKAVTQSPEDPDARYRLGASLVRAGQILQGIKELQTALTLQPDFPQARKALEMAGALEKSKG